MSGGVGDGKTELDSRKWNGRITDFRDLRVYQNSVEAAMTVFQLTRTFPSEERYSLVDQMRRSSRSVCANLGEAWRKRRYPAHFISKLSDAEGEAEETRIWLEFAYRCGYLSERQAHDLDATYHVVLGQLVKMISQPESWTVS